MTIVAVWGNYQILVSRELTNMELIPQNTHEEVETLVYCNSQNEAQIR